MTTPETSTTTSHSTDITKDKLIPLFNNRIADYREWRLRIGLYHRKMALQNKKEEATINLLTSLSGWAWRQIEHCMLRTNWLMRKEDSAEPFRCLMPASSTMRRWRCLEPLKSFSTVFIADLTRRCFHTSGWLLLPRAGPTMEQRQLVQTNVGSLHGRNEDRRSNVSAVWSGLSKSFQSSA